MERKKLEINNCGPNLEKDGGSNKKGLWLTIDLCMCWWLLAFIISRNPIRSLDLFSVNKGKHRTDGEGEEWKRRTYPSEIQMKMEGVDPVIE